ncbi:MAG: sortase [Clostridia bacterium]|nr:sortase [Clostridia bacterium]
MNQILISEKLYVTPELKRKKKMYKFDFFISIFLVCILFSYYVYAEYNKTKSEQESQEILSGLTFAENLADDTTITFEENAIVVILNSEDNYEVIVEEPPKLEVTEELIQKNTSVSPSGQEYYTIATINIPSINCHYPILNLTTDELLKISPCYFWGAEPNKEGNFCIVGHNYRSDKFFSKVPKLENGEIIEIKDLTGKTVKYKVYDKYIVEPEDVSCTSQLTNGKTEITVITCTNDSKKRVVVKATAITE